MPQWTVDGAFRDSGKETTLLVEAPTADAASSVASERGVVVSGIHLSAATVSASGAERAGQVASSATETKHLEYLLAGSVGKDRQLEWTIRILTWLAYGLAVVAVWQFGLAVPDMVTRIELGGYPPRKLGHTLSVVLKGVEGLLFSLMYPAGVYSVATLLRYLRRPAVDRG